MFYICTYVQHSMIMRLIVRSSQREKQQTVGLLDMYKKAGSLLRNDTDNNNK